jgi:hypothetical protein
VICSALVKTSDYFPAGLSADKNYDLLEASLDSGSHPKDEVMMKESLGLGFILEGS